MRSEKSPQQLKALWDLYQNPQAKIHGGVRKALEARGCLKDGAITISGIHALGEFKHCPALPVPTPDQIAALSTQTVAVEEFFQGDPETAAIFGWSTSSAANTYILDAGLILNTYLQLVLAANAHLKEQWSISYDRDVEHFGKQRSAVFGYMINQAVTAVESKGQYFGYYTGHICIAICKALLSDKPDRTTVITTSHKYSFHDTEDEIAHLLCAHDVTPVRTFEYDFHH